MWFKKWKQALALCCGIIALLPSCSTDQESLPEFQSTTGKADEYGVLGLTGTDHDPNVSTVTSCSDMILVDNQGVKNQCINCNERICQGIFNAWGEEDTEIAFSHNYRVVTIKFPWYHRSRAAEIPFRYTGNDKLDNLCNFLFPGSHHIQVEETNGVPSGPHYYTYPWGSSSGSPAYAACFNDAGVLNYDTESDLRNGTPKCPGDSRIHTIKCESTTASPLGKLFVTPRGFQPNCSAEAKKTGATCSSNEGCAPGYHCVSSWRISKSGQRGTGKYWSWYPTSMCAPENECAFSIEKSLYPPMDCWNDLQFMSEKALCPCQIVYYRTSNQIVKVRRDLYVVDSLMKDGSVFPDDGTSTTFECKINEQGKYYVPLPDNVKNKKS